MLVIFANDCSRPGLEGQTRGEYPRSVDERLIKALPSLSPMESLRGIVFRAMAVPSVVWFGFVVQLCLVGISFCQLFSVPWMAPALHWPCQLHVIKCDFTFFPEVKYFQLLSREK